MRVLHVITHYHPHVYGAENFAQHIAEYQANQLGWEVDVLTGRWNSEWKETEVFNRVTIHRVPVVKIRYLQTILAVIPLYQNAKKLIRQKNTYILHSHIYPAMIVGALVSKDVQFIATIQGGDLGDYPEVYGPFAPIAKKIIAQSLSRAQKIHCVSRYLKQQVINLTGDDNKITVIPNGLNLEEFTPARYQKKTTRVRFISTSRLERKNNLDRLIAAFKYLIQQKGLKITLDIYGDGSQREYLQNLIRKSNLDSYLRLKGYLSPSKLPKQLTKYDAFIRLSSQEGFGISFIEAIAAGLVPIGSNRDAIPELIKHQVTGYIVNLNQSVEAQLHRVLRQQSRWQSIIQNARREVTERYSWKKVFSEVDELYKTV